jgi:hypothetical protein
MASTPATSLALVTSGLADARLSAPLGNPDVRQFLNVVRKTTRWSAQWNRVDFDGSPEFGTRVSMTLPRIAELVSGFTLIVTMPDIYAPQLAAIQAAGGSSLDDPGTFLGPVYGWTNSLGHSLIERIEFEIGGAIVETLDGRLLEILDELYETVDSVFAKNAMIARAPSGFSARTFLSPTPLTVKIPIPFWFSRPGVYSHALPLDALQSENVRVHVTFRAVNQLYFTAARVDTRTVGWAACGSPTAGTMWPLTGGRFWRSLPTATTRVYSMNTTTPANGIAGDLIPGVQMPARLSPVSAYALVEYISLEEYEALAFRTGELTYHVEQHNAVQVEQTQGLKELRVAIPYTNPTKELLWVCQRPEAETYNAWFLFTRDLGPARPVNLDPPNICALPWWPDAQLVPSVEQGWQIVPGFQQSFSEPLDGAALHYNSYERFAHTGASFFRGVVPARSYTKSAVINRYVYAYAFGQPMKRLEYEPSGAANWDKINRKELFLTMNSGRCSAPPPNLNVYVYTTNWNIFKVYGGRGGMLFSN